MTIIKVQKSRANTFIPTSSQKFVWIFKFGESFHCSRSTDKYSSDFSNVCSLKSVKKLSLVSNLPIREYKKYACVVALQIAVYWLQ